MAKLTPYEISFLTLNALKVSQSIRPEQEMSFEEREAFNHGVAVGIDMSLKMIDVHFERVTTPKSPAPEGH